MNPKSNLTYSKEEITGIVRLCLQKLRRFDQYLLDIKVNERTISHKLAEYLQECFPEFHVDCEYNRFEDLVKKLNIPEDNIDWDDTQAKTVFPDIIIHIRGSQHYNLLVIEVKKSTNKNKGSFDKLKIQTFCKKPYNYTHGLFLRIGLKGEKDYLEWFPK